MAQHPREEHQADQVVRRRQFEEANPGVQICWRPGAAWAGVVPVPGGEEIITAFELRELLDRLERSSPPLRPPRE
jgi:hypothetical protein